MALRHEQVDYFADFDNQIASWNGANTYAVGTIVNDGGLQWKALAVNTNSRPTSSNANWEEFDFAGQGYYQFISLENIVNNFMLSSLDDTQDLTKKIIDRHEVEFWAQRAVQEFSQDVLSFVDFEYELVDSLTLPMPQGLTKVVAITFVDEYGVEQHIQPRLNSSNPKSVSQNSDGTIQFKSNGDILFANDSEALRVYNQNANINQASGQGSFTGGAGYYEYGSIWHLQPQTSTGNGTYVINVADGTISFDSTLMGETIVLKYISDGLSENFAEVKVPKSCEDAIDAWVYYRLIRRSKANLYEKGLARKESSALLRNAKIRLNDFSPRNMIQLLRAQNQWIKV